MKTKVVFKLGDDISTDAIYPGRFMATVLPTETPQYAFIDYKEFNSKLISKQIPPNSVIVANNNFGCGSSREQAASTLKGWELIIVAKNFAIEPLPKARQAIIDAGGLIAYTRKKLIEKAGG